MQFFNRHLYLLLVFFLAISGCVENQPQLWNHGSQILSNVLSEQRPLTTEEISLGLKDALKVGTERVVEQIGRKNGFNHDPKIHIPLPGTLVKVQSTLENIGLAYMLDDLEVRLNRAAEVATPKARALFWQSIRQMRFTDIMAIYNGPDDAATRYFQRTMTPNLVREMRPVVSNSLDQVGAIQAYDRAIGRYRALPFVPDVKADLTSYVVEQGVNGIFYYLAKEEQAIRQNPAKRTTELLQRVFAAN